LKAKAALVGSVSSRSLEQLSRLESSGIAPWLSLDAPLPKALPGNFALSTLRSRDSIQSLRGAKAQAAFAAGLLKRLVHSALKLSGDPGRRLWLLTGGHTAEAFFSALGLRGSRVHGLLLPGLTLLEADGPKGIKIWASSKPGGFGDRDLMLNFMKLKGRK
jgi:uncharacterized protein YgbK (DUF1537 family)